MRAGSFEALIQEGGLVPLVVWARGFGNIPAQQLAIDALHKLGIDIKSMEAGSVTIM